jgi:hypothetical protein
MAGCGAGMAEAPCVLRGSGLAAEALQDEGVLRCVGFKGHHPDEAQSAVSTEAQDSRGTLTCYCFCNKSAIVGGLTSGWVALTGLKIAVRRTALSFSSNFVCGLDRRDRYVCIIALL